MNIGIEAKQNKEFSLHGLVAQSSEKLQKNTEYANIRPENIDRIKSDIAKIDEWYEVLCSDPDRQPNMLSKDDFYSILAYYQEKNKERTTAESGDESKDLQEEFKCAKEMLHKSYAGAYCENLGFDEALALVVLDEHEISDLDGFSASLWNGGFGDLSESDIEDIAKTLRCSHPFPEDLLQYLSIKDEDGESRAESYFGLSMDAEFAKQMLPVFLDGRDGVVAEGRGELWCNAFDELDKEFLCQVFYSLDGKDSYIVAGRFLTKINYNLFKDLDSQIAEFILENFRNDRHVIVNLIKDIGRFDGFVPDANLAKIMISELGYADIVMNNLDKFIDFEPDNGLAEELLFGARPQPEAVMNHTELFPGYSFDAKLAMSMLSKGAQRKNESEDLSGQYFGKQMMLAPFYFGKKFSGFQLNKDIASIYLDSEINEVFSGNARLCPLGIYVFTGLDLDFLYRFAEKCETSNHIVETVGAIDDLSNDNAEGCIEKIMEIVERRWSQWEADKAGKAIREYVETGVMPKGLVYLVNPVSSWATQSFRQYTTLDPSSEEYERRLERYSRTC
jgi:hypothetical protein